MKIELDLKGGLRTDMSVICYFTFHFRLLIQQIEKKPKPILPALFDFTPEGKKRNIKTNAATIFVDESFTKKHFLYSRAKIIPKSFLQAQIIST